jgi:hypothetical protein
LGRQELDKASMNEPNPVPGTGRHFGIAESLGGFSPVPLLQAIDATLPPGVVVRFVTPIGRQLREYLREHGRKVKGRLWQRHWELVHDPQAGTLNKLTAFIRDNAISNLAVWFLVIDASGVCILEMEDGNDYVWLSDELEGATIKRIVEAAGGSV